MGYNLFPSVQAVQPVGEATGTVTGSTVGTVAAQRVGTSYNPYMGGSNNAQGAVDYLASMYTSPEQEERYRKASVQRQRIMAVGDALRHIGNIYNTVNGAPAQTFNSPVQEEKARYQQEKGIRDASNYRYMSYQQAKAAQDAKQRQWEADYGLKAAGVASQDAYRREQARLAGERAESQKAYNEGMLAARNRSIDATIKNNEDRLRETRRVNNARISQGNQRINIAKQNLEYKKSGAGKGSTIAPLDTPRGKITPSARDYSDQVRQLYDYAVENNYVKGDELQSRLSAAGLGKETPDAAKRQIVMNALRTNQALADYAESRLGWSYNGGSAGTDWSQYAEGEEEEEEDWNDYLEE